MRSTRPLIRVPVFGAAAVAMVTLAIATIATATLVAAQTAPLNPAAEKLALEALAKPSPPKAFPVEAIAFHVPVPGHPGLVSAYVRIPGGSLVFAGDARIGTYTAGAAVVLRFVNESGAVVHSDSESFPFSGLLSEAKATLAKPVQFSRRVDLPPGAYRMQVAVYDEGGKQASVLVQPLVIPPPTWPIVGDLMVVEHADVVPADHPPDRENPFVVGQFVLRPAMDPGVNRGLQPDINFILAVVVAPGTVAPPMRLTLLAQDGQSLASVPLPVKPPEPDGKLFIVGRVPLAKIPPNKYTLQIAVGTWPDAILRKSTLTVVD